MAKKDRYLVALDIGSTKTCALIADIENGSTKFMAMGAAESKGSRKGLIVNLDAAVTSIRRALEEAEGIANVPVENAIVGVSGSHVRGVNSRGGVTLGNRPRYTSEFAIVGDDYSQDGPITSWRAVLIENNVIVALLQSRIWQ